MNLYKVKLNYTHTISDQVLAANAQDAVGKMRDEVMQMDSMDQDSITDITEQEPEVELIAEAPEDLDPKKLNFTSIYKGFVIVHYAYNGICTCAAYLHGKKVYGHVEDERELMRWIDAKVKAFEDSLLQGSKDE